jgi:hypothetical protein
MVVNETILIEDSESLNDSKKTDILVQVRESRQLGQGEVRSKRLEITGIPHLHPAAVFFGLRSL